MSTMGRDQALDILEHCFSKADWVKVIHHTHVDGNSHFTSNVNRFTVEYKQDGKLHRKRVVIKAPISEIFDLLDGNTFKFFSREIGLYEVVLPKVTKYLDKSLVPTHLHTTKSKILVLEDVTALGYESGEKLPLFNLNRTKAVLKALAHFHAASHKLHEEDPHLLENLLSDHVPFVEGRKTSIKNWELFVLELLKCKNEKSLIPGVRAAIGFLKKEDDKIKALISQSRFKFVVLVHGDSRKDNLLLKHGSNNQVEGVQFIDFQCSLWSSPLLDIFYFFTTSVLFEVVETHYNDLVDGYLYELNEKLKKLGCSSLYKRKDFDSDFKKLRIFLFTSILLMCTYISPMDHEQRNKIWTQRQAVVGHHYNSLLNDNMFVHTVHGWLKFCEKCNVFDSY